MIHKPIAIMILPIALAGILILAVLTAIPSKNHAFAFGNSFTFASPTSSEENNNAGSTQESNNNGSTQESNNNGSTQESNNNGSTQESNNNGSTQQPSNNTGKAYCDSCNNDIYSGSADFANMVLAVHNRERAAVGVPPLVWSDKLAADAKPYAEHLLTTAELEHPSQEWVDAHPNSVPGYEGENLAWRGNTTTVPIAQMQQGWISEKNNYHGEPGDFNGVGHYTQMVWRDTKEVGCAAASGGPHGRDVLDCRYSPVGNILGQKPY
jgi:uncharacterized protein YkwD